MVILSDHETFEGLNMISFDCLQCGKGYQVEDQRAGQQARCECGGILKVPTPSQRSVATIIAESAVCPNCQEPVLPNWKACPSCATQLASTPAVNAPSPASEIQAGDNSVVNAVINKPVTMNNPRSTAPPTAVAPMINVGAESVVSANIDASTNIHNDHSRTIHGQYVESQTFVHVGPIVQKMTVSFSSEVASDIERSLPDDPSSLIAILAETNRFLIRNDTIRFRQHVAGGLWKNLAAKDGLFDSDLGRRKRASAEYNAMERLIDGRRDLCLQITNKLHGIAANTGDQTLACDIEALDECVLSVKQAHDNIKWLDKRKQGDWWILIIILCMGVIFSPLAIPLGIYVSRRILSLQGSLGHDLARADSRLARLVFRHQYKSQIMNLLCAVATADGHLTSDEARSVRSAIAKLEYSASDSILNDCLNAWRYYARQNTVAANIDAVLRDIEPLARTDDAKRIYQAAVSVAKSDDQLHSDESKLLRTLREILDIAGPARTLGKLQ